MIIKNWKEICISRHDINILNYFLRLSQHSIQIQRDSGLPDLDQSSASDTPLSCNVPTTIHVGTDFPTLINGNNKFQNNSSTCSNYINGGKNPARVKVVIPHWQVKWPLAYAYKFSSWSWFFWFRFSILLVNTNIPNRSLSLHWSLILYIFMTFPYCFTSWNFHST